MAASASNPAVPRFYWKRAYVAPDTSAIARAHPCLPGEIIELDWLGSECERFRCEPSPDLLYRGEGDGQVRDNVHSLLTQAVDSRLEQQSRSCRLALRWN